MKRCLTLKFMTFGLCAAVMLAAPIAHAHETPTVEALAPLPPAASLVPVEGAGLFVPLSATAGPTMAERMVLRSRIVQVDAGYRDRMLLAPAAEAVPDSVQVFTLPLFDDTRIKVIKTESHVDSLGSQIWNGRVLDPAGGEALLVFHEGHATGWIRAGAHAYAIEPTADGQTRIAETDLSKQLHADPLVPPRRPHAAVAPKPQAGIPSQINILVGYTPQAAALTNDITAAISAAMAYTDTVLSNSQIPTRMNLVGAVEVNYTESAGEVSSKILQDLTYGIGGFSQLHAQRDALKADLVSVWTVFQDACGLSWVLAEADTVDDSPYGFNVISTLPSFNCVPTAVAHEIGHNFGAHHDRYVDDPNDQDTTHFDYAYIDLTGSGFRTMMSYPNECEAHFGADCPLIPYHSTLALTYNGRPLGTGPDTAANAADNTTRIKQILPYIGQFRSQSPTPPVAPLVDAILPSSRSVQTSSNPNATFFMTVINTTGTTATKCGLNGLQYADSSTGGFSYDWTWQTTNPANNEPTGTAFTPVSIAPGGLQTFYAGVNFSSPIAATFQMLVSCDNADTASVIPGVNTLQLTVSSSPVPDVIALAETATQDGTIHVPTGGSNAFAVATTDLGAGGTILVTVDTGTTTLPVSLSICQTNPSTAQCLAAPAGTVTHNFTTNETPTFSVFATATGPIAANPAIDRVFVHFTDASGGTVRGSTSVAIQSP